MATEVTLPALGESVSEGTISRWLKAVGDTVEADEPLLEVSTDKVDTEIPSPAAGTLLEIRFQEDDVAEVGAVLAIVGDAAAAPAAPAPVPEPAPAPEPTPAPPAPAAPAPAPVAPAAPAPAAPAPAAPVAHSPAVADAVARRAARCIQGAGAGRCAPPPSPRCRTTRPAPATTPRRGACRESPPAASPGRRLRHGGGRPAVRRRAGTACPAWRQSAIRWWRWPPGWRAAPACGR